jgi:hypothetical protein
VVDEVTRHCGWTVGAKDKRQLIMSHIQILIMDAKRAKPPT